jgi:predicted  nucleic acid-binding Zn-ribbon protein
MRERLYDWEKASDEWEYRNNKTLTGDKVKPLDELLGKMHGYDNAIGILFDDIEDQRDKIADKKSKIKESVSNLRKRQLEAEIKAAETIIETKKKEQIREYRKAYKEINPELEKVK